MRFPEEERILAPGDIRIRAAETALPEVSSPTLSCRVQTGRPLGVAALTELTSNVGDPWEMNDTSMPGVPYCAELCGGKYAGKVVGGSELAGEVQGGACSWCMPGDASLIQCRELDPKEGRERAVMIYLMTVIIFQMTLRNIIRGVCVCVWGGLLLNIASPTSLPKGRLDAQVLQPVPCPSSDGFPHMPHDLCSLVILRMTEWVDLSG